MEWEYFLNHCVWCDHIVHHLFIPMMRRSDEAGPAGHRCPMQTTGPTIGTKRRGKIFKAETLQLHLKKFCYRAMPDDVVVIDEPEQNLHPTQQAKFIEFLSLLVNRGFQVALTTHSPYIIQHLQSLILAYDLTDKEKEEVISQLYLKQADSLINKEKIGVYLFQNGTSEDILSTNGEINWQTFCDTADTVDGISNLVYSKRGEE